MSTVTSQDGTTIDHDAFGSGPTVVFIGGATQHRALDASGSALAKLMAERGFTAIDYDRRGRGRSGDAGRWTVQREVEDVAALIGAHGGSAALVTSSSGATIALAAATAGIGVTALALYEPPMRPGVDGSADLATIQEFLAAGDRDAAMRHNLVSVVGLPSQAVDGMSGSPWWPTMLSVAPTLPYDLAAVHEVNVDPEWSARWSGVTVPTVVLSGEQTAPKLTLASDAVAAAIPHASRVVLPGQGHGPAAEALVPVLVDFLRTA